MMSAAVSGCCRGTQNILMLYLNWQGLTISGIFAVLVGAWRYGCQTKKPRMSCKESPVNLFHFFHSKVFSVLFLLWGSMCLFGLQLLLSMLSFIWNKFPPSSTKSKRLKCLGSSSTFSISWSDQHLQTKWSLMDICPHTCALFPSMHYMVSPT